MFPSLRGVKGQSFRSLFRYVGLYFDQMLQPSDLWGQHHADIQANSPRYKADTSSLKHLVKVSNYWCHPDSLFTRLSQVGWVTAHGTCCRLPDIIRTQCELIRRKTGECMWGDCMEPSACSSSTCCNSAKKLHDDLNIMGIILSIISVTSISRLSLKNLKPLIRFSTAVVAQGSWVLMFLVTYTKLTDEK